MWKSAVWQVVPSKYDCESNDIGEEDPLQNNQSQSLLQAENAIDNEDADMSGVLNFSAGNDEFEISRMEEFSQDGQHEQDENNDISLSPSPAHTPPPPGIDTQEQTPNLITVPNWETITAVSSIARTAVSSTALVLTTSGTISTHVSTITTTTNATTTSMSTNNSRRRYQRNSTALGLYF